MVDLELLFVCLFILYFCLSTYVLLSIALKGILLIVLLLKGYSCTGSI